MVGVVGSNPIAPTKYKKPRNAGLFTLGLYGLMALSMTLACLVVLVINLDPVCRFDGAGGDLYDRSLCCS